jgi:hypothetical protein
VNAADDGPRLRQWDLASSGMPVSQTQPAVGASLATDGVSLYTCDSSADAFGKVRRYAWDGHEQTLTPAVTHT